MEVMSWFSKRTTTSWSKLLTASTDTGREPDESPGVGIARRLQAENTRTTKRRHAISVGGGCGRAEDRIESTNVGTAPYLCGRYIRTRARLSPLVAAMWNTVAAVENFLFQNSKIVITSGDRSATTKGDSPEKKA